MPIFWKELNNAEKQETYIKPVLEKYFNVKLQKLDQFNLFDFVSDDKKLYIEMKTRNCNLEHYNTSIVGKNKLDEASKLSKHNITVIFIFKFIDGTFYHIYDKDYNYIIKKCGRTDRGINEIKNYCFINTKDLIKIN